MHTLNNENDSNWYFSTIASYQPREEDSNALSMWMYPSLLIVDLRNLFNLDVQADAIQYNALLLSISRYICTAHL